MTTIGQRPWLGIHRICIEGVLSELSGWTYYSCCFLTWAQQGAALCQLCESTPTGICSNGKQCTGHSEQPFTLFSSWTWEWDCGQEGFGLGGKWKRANWFRNINKTEVHPSKWKSSLARSDGLCFLLECGKDGAGRSLTSEIGFT